jgi:acyl-CoA thioesterase-1
MLTTALIACTAQAVPATGAAESSQPSPPAELSAKAAEKILPLRFLALGDSYTIGEGVRETERWPNLLALALEARGVRVATPEIIARTGWTTADLTHAIERSQLTPPYDLVTLLIGVNDQFQGYQESSYPQRFRQLLERAIGLAGGDSKRAIVISIPDYSVTPFAKRFDPPAIHAALERYNEVNRNISNEMGVAHVDITALSRGAQKDLTLLAADQLHPSAKMYRGWVELVLPAAEEALRKDAR